MNSYYIYLHIKETTGEPFYIGKGKNQRAYVKQYRNTFWNNIVKKHNYDIIILEENLSEDQALLQEQYWIKRIGRRDLNTGTLVNLTDGGDGQKGYVYTDLHKANMRKAKLGRKVKHKKHKSPVFTKIRKIHNKHKPHKIHEYTIESKNTLKLKCKTKSLDFWNSLSNEEYNVLIKNMGRKKDIFKVQQLTIDNIIIKNWDSHHEAADFINSSKPNHILDVCKGLKKSHKKYIWKFI